MDLLGVGAVVLVAIEWMALGWLSGVDWPFAQQVFWAPRWAMRLLVGSFLVALAQLVLAEIGLGIGNIALVLAAASVSAAAIRVVLAQSRCVPTPTTANIRDPKPTTSIPEPNPTADVTVPKPKPVAMNSRERIGWLLLGSVLLAATVRSFLVPEAGWDAFSHWGLRAQAYALAGTIVNAHSEHEYYPPLIPLLEAWLYVHRGGVSIDLGKTLWALVGSAFAVCLGWHLRLSLRIAWVAPLFAIGIVLGTTAFVEGFWTGQADLALTAYLTLGTQIGRAS